MSEFDQRQYARMLESLEAFQEHRLSLPKVISNLKGLIACLEDPIDEIKSSLKKNWAILEEIYAVSEDQSLTKLPTEYETLVNKSISEMRSMLERVLVTDRRK